MNRWYSSTSLARDTRIYRRSVLRLAALGLVPAMGLTALLASREYLAHDAGLPKLLEPRLFLPSVHNFRDIAGVYSDAPYRNIHGVPLRRRVLYRSGWISADESDLQRLRALRIERIYDLRSAELRERLPDHVPQGASIVPIDVMDAVLNPRVWMPLWADGDLSVAMEEFMRRLVTDAHMRASTARLLQALAQGVTGAQLYHCAQGEDVTGWITALLHSIAELPPELILHDYLLSNERLLPPGSATRDGASVRANYLHAAMDVAIARHGSLLRFVQEGLQVNADTLQRLRARMLQA